jgi:sec-independent protein translocase protein TatB
MLSFPHLVVLFVIALVIFGPQKLPELARMLGKATAEFRKMTNDFRYALEDEVRELERQTRIKEQEAAAARAAQVPVPSIQAPGASPDGAVPRELPAASANESAPNASPADLSTQSHPSVQADSNSPQPQPVETVRAPQEKSSDDNAAV